MKRLDDMNVSSCVLCHSLPPKLSSKVKGLVDWGWCCGAVRGAEKRLVLSEGHLVALSVVLKPASAHSGRGWKPGGTIPARFCPLSLSLSSISRLFICHCLSPVITPHLHLLLHLSGDLFTTFTQTTVIWVYLTLFFFNKCGNVSLINVCILSMEQMMLRML